MLAEITRFFIHPGGSQSTNYGHFLALKHLYTTQSVAELILREVVRLHGFYSTIILIETKCFSAYSRRNYLNYWNCLEV